MDKNIKKNNLQIKGFFDKLTSTISYVVYDKFSKECAVIDSVLDFDYSSGSIDYLNAENIISFIEKNNLSLIWLIDPKFSWTNLKFLILFLISSLLISYLVVYFLYFPLVVRQILL